MPKRAGKHLDVKDRVIIEQMLHEGQSMRAIAKELNCAPSTISREIKAHAEERVPRNCDCIHFKDCNRRDACHPGQNCRKLCRTCSMGKKSCPDYVKAYCDDAEENGTGVCNFCDKRSRCHYTRSVYEAMKAQAKADKDLKDPRSGRNITEEHIDKIDSIVTPLIKKGQSVYHITQVHGKELGISESTLRRMVNGCDIGARNIDLRCTVQRKVRRKRVDNSYKTMQIIKEGHKYEDFKSYIAENDVAYVEMDCVEGCKTDTSAIMTLHFPLCHMQIALKLSEHESKDVVDALDLLEQALGSNLFMECFPLILTDNGHEFADIEGMERSVNGGRRTMVFFCEPNRSDEKGACENNHKYMRYIIPKGTSIDGFTQQDISLMMDHINSFKRKSLGGKCPYEVAAMMLPDDLFGLLGLEQIAPDEVNLTPSLLIHPS